MVIFTHLKGISNGALLLSLIVCTKVNIEVSSLNITLHFINPLARLQILLGRRGDIMGDTWGRRWILKNSDTRIAKV